MPVFDVTFDRYTHKDWADKSFWRFIGKQSFDQQMEAQEINKRHPDDMTQEDMIDQILLYSEGWFGKEFYCPPKTMKDPDTGEQIDVWVKLFGDRADQVEGEPGKLAPCNADWIGVIPADQIVDIFNHLRELYAGRTGAAQATFPEANQAVDRPAGQSQAAPAR